MSPFAKKVGYQGLRFGLTALLGSISLYFLHIPTLLGTLVTLLFFPLYGLVHAGVFSAATVAPIASAISFVGIQILMNPLFVCVALAVLVLPSLCSLLVYCCTGVSQAIPSLWSFLGTCLSGPPAEAPQATEPAIVPTPASAPTTPDGDEYPPFHVSGLKTNSPLAAALLLSQRQSMEQTPCMEASVKATSLTHLDRISVTASV